MLKLLAPAFAAALFLALAVPLLGARGAEAHTVGPCNNGVENVASADEGATGFNYARHHISALAKDGMLGAGGHIPGSHHGFSTCSPGQNP